MKTLKTDYKVWKYLVFGFLTIGIYPIVVRTKISNGLNKITTGTGAKKTMNFCLVYFLFSPLTLTIALYIWFQNISKKFSNELERRDIDYKFSEKDFWLWNNLGSLIFIGPVIYLAKMFKAYKFLAEQYNSEITLGAIDDYSKIA